MFERIPRPFRRAQLAATLLAFAALGVVTAPASAVGCDRTDTPARLAATLNPGEVGCVRAGTHTGAIKITRPGITITSYPGERAKIFGRVWIAAADVTIESLDLDARQTGNQPNVLVTGDRARVNDNDITNGNTAICVALGVATWTPTVTVHDVVISGNRIHDCGRLPATNHDHGIYVENSVGAQIIDNAIYDNADRAINLYPNADATLIRGNVMDGNGEGVLFSGDLGMTSDDNVLEGNVITNPKLREAVESWWADAPVRGTGNVVRGNCVHGGAGTIDSSGGGFSIGLGNLFVDPGYADRAAKDFRLTAGSACALLTGVPTVSGSVPPVVVETPPVVVETPPVVVSSPPVVSAPARPVTAAPATSEFASPGTAGPATVSTMTTAAPTPAAPRKKTARMRAASKACAAARHGSAKRRKAAKRACARIARRPR